MFIFNSVTLPSGAILHTGSGVNYPVGASVAETPEPSTLLLLDTGFIGLAATRRRKL
jgi:PEP-CTERM motif